MNTKQRLKEGIAHQQAGRFEQAEVVFREILAANPNHAEAWQRLGLLAQRSGNLEAALDCFNRAAQAQPHGVEILNHLGVALAQGNRLDEARDVFQRACLLRPDLPASPHNLGNVYRRLGKFEEAERAYMRAICLKPASANLHFTFGKFLKEQGRLLEAVVSFRNACQSEPNRAELHRTLGNALANLSRSQDALEHLSRALALSPEDAELHYELGNTYRQLNQTREAVAHYQEAVRIKPNFAPARTSLANLLAKEGKVEMAREVYRQAQALDPRSRTRVVAELLLPVIYDSPDHVRETRERFTTTLHNFEASGLRLDPTKELMPTHFYLAYQGFNDRDLHACAARLGSGSRRLNIRPGPRPAGNRIRIGFLSTHLGQHTIGLLNHGLIAQLSRDQFEVIVLTTFPFDDSVAMRIQQCVDRTVLIPQAIGAALGIIAGLGLDILYLPDIGMDTLTYTIAFSRLAPVQCVTWGHPVTTGLPTVDYFLSSETLEGADADGHYTEQLVRLPRLGVYYERLLLRARKDRDFFGLPARAHLYLCPQALFKFHPEFDALLAAILQGDPEGILVLIEGKNRNWTELLSQRFNRTLGRLVDRVRFLPEQRRDRFLGLLDLADVMLDPIHFGGGHTSYEAFSFGVPIVTLPSPFLRGRLTQAMYRQMGFLDLVAEDPASYIRKALQVGTDADYRNHLRQQIRDASQVLFEDAQAIRALEEFFRQALERAPSS